MSKAGPLDPPPGPIGPTGKTLQEIYDKVSSTSTKVAVSDQGVAEPRTPVRSLPSTASALGVSDRDPTRTGVGVG